MDSPSAIPVKHSLHEPLLVVFGMAVTGIVADRFGGLSIDSWLTLSMVSLASWVLWRQILPSNPINRYGGSWIPLCLSVCGVAAVWHHLYWNYYPTSDVGRFAIDQPQPVCLQAQVHTVPQNKRSISDPLCVRTHDEQCQFVVHTVALRTRAYTWVPASGKLRVRVVGQLEGISAGDMVTLWGIITPPSDAWNPGGASNLEFARSKRHVGCLSVKHADCVRLEGRASLWNPLWLLRRSSGHFQDVLSRHVEGPARDVALAVLLGVRDHVDGPTSEAFLVTGTVHLLAISGLHLGIIAYVLLIALVTVRVPRTIALWTVMLFCLAFAVMVGFRAPVLRATVIVWVACIGLLTYRTCLSFNTLAAAGLTVLAINPTEVFAAGAQLSFLAVAAIIWIVPKISQQSAGRVAMQVYKHHHTLGRMVMAKFVRKLFTAALATTVVWVLAVPLVMYHFNLFSPVALILNAVLWIPLAIGLISGLVTMALGWAPPLLVSIPASVCEQSLGLLVEAAQSAAAWPWGHYWTPGPPLEAVVAFYGAVTTSVLIPVLRLCWKLMIPAGWVMIAAVWTGTALSPSGASEELRITFLSVGHGTCVVMRMPDGTVWLYDAGSCIDPRFAVREISQHLWSQGVTTLGGVIISHADLDHFNAVPGLARRFPISCIYASQKTLDSSRPGIKVLLDEVHRAAVPVQCLQNGYRIPTAAMVSISVVHLDEDASLSDNESSIVLELVYAGRRILLPGDLEGVGLRGLLDQPPLDFDLVMAPHHGSRHSAPAEFCEWANPDWIVVSCCRSRSPDPRHELYRASKAKVLATGQLGAVEARITRDVLAVESWLVSSP